VIAVTGTSTRPRLINASTVREPPGKCVGELSRLALNLRERIGASSA
jgi:hypothetical protein